MINKAQEKIIKEAKLPALIIAGPGTGKTFTIVQKVVDLVKNHGYKANRILITTFTKKAASELNTRILSEFKKQGIQKDLNDMKIGNFHSLANIFLEDYKRLDSSFFKAKVIDSYFEGYLIEKNLDKFKEISDFSKYFKGNHVRRIQGIFEDITNNLIDLNILKNSNNPQDRLAYDVYKVHKNLLERYKLMNFQMILKSFYDLLSDEIIGQKIRDSIDFVIIDEYQDTNYIQQEIAFKLIKDKNIMVFGDDDQALYSFRGADPSNLTNFSEVCKEKLGLAANFYSLDTNYRSNQAIIDFANRWMKDKDRNRNKKLQSIDKKSNENTLVRAKSYNFYNIYRIIKLLNKEINLNQIAFLFPTLNNSYPKNLEKFFRNKGINVINKGASEFFYRREIRIIIYIFASIFSQYPENLYYNPYMSYDERQEYDFSQYIRELFDEKSFKTKEIDQFVRCFRENKDLSLSEILYKSFSLGIIKEILDKKIDRIESSRALHNIGIFTILVSEYEEIFRADGTDYYKDFIYAYLFYFYKTSAIKEFEHIDNNYDAINFMTIHNAKGLEFEVVFVSGLNDCPRENYPKILDKYDKADKAIDAKDKDFYRKYYTAFTRAKNLLVLLDNSRDLKLRNFASSLNDSSLLRSIDFSRKDPQKEKAILAYTTDIELYLSCPLKYKFLRKLDFKLPQNKRANFGSQIHQLAEYVAVSKRENRDLGEIYDFLRNNPRYKESIFNFMENNFDIVQTEVNYKADRDFYILQGNVDIVLSTGSIMDIKTGTYNKEVLEKYKKQLITYKNLMILNDMNPAQMFLYFIEKNQLIEVNDESFDIDQIDNIAGKIVDEEIYKKTENIEECKYCPMKFYCQRYWYYPTM